MTASQTFCHQLWQFYGDKKIQDKYYIYLKEHCSIYNIFGVVLIILGVVLICIFSVQRKSCSIAQGWWILPLG